MRNYHALPQRPDSGHDLAVRAKLKRIGVIAIGAVGGALTVASQTNAPSLVSNLASYLKLAGINHLPTTVAGIGVDVAALWAGVALIAVALIWLILPSPSPVSLTDRLVIEHTKFRRKEDGSGVVAELQVRSASSVPLHPGSHGFSVMFYDATTRPGDKEIDAISAERVAALRRQPVPRTVTIEQGEQYFTPIDALLDDAIWQEFLSGKQKLLVWAFKSFSDANTPRSRIKVAYRVTEYEAQADGTSRAQDLRSGTTIYRRKLLGSNHPIARLLRPSRPNTGPRTPQ